MDNPANPKMAKMATLEKDIFTHIENKILLLLFVFRFDVKQINLHLVSKSVPELFFLAFYDRFAGKHTEHNREQRTERHN